MESFDEKLPPTRASLVPTIQRAHFQALIWFQDNQAHHFLPPVTNYGWENDDHGGIRPIMCTLPPALEAILELVRCGCVKSKCTTRKCKCLTKQMANKRTSTELCGCWSDEEAMCENYGKYDTETENDSNDEEEAVDGHDVL